jgi:hypothetical protein
LSAVHCAWTLSRSANTKARQFYVKLLDDNTNSLRVPQLNGLEFVNCVFDTKAKDRVSLFSHTHWLRGQGDDQDAPRDAAMKYHVTL